MKQCHYGSRKVTETYLEKLIRLQPIARATLKKMDRSLPVELPDPGKKKCRKCGEFWPETDEFFCRNPRNGVLRSPCRACIDEKRAETNAVTACAVPGCQQPRYSGRYSYCWDHRHVNARRAVQI